MTRLACSRSLRCTVPSCICRSGWALGCDVRSEQFGRRGGHGAGAEPASRESENRHFFRWGSATGSRANRRFRPRPPLFIPLVLFLGSKQFFDLCLGYPIFWYPTVAPEPRAGVWDTLPEVFFETFVSQWLLSGLFYTRDSGGCARAHPPGVAPEALEE